MAGTHLRFLIWLFWYVRTGTAARLGVKDGKALTINIDYVRLRFVESISISKFKATCLAVLKQVRNTGQPVRVTRFGMAIADVVPPGPPEGSADWLGSMAGTARTVGDITVPTYELVDWDAERE